MNALSKGSFTKAATAVAVAALLHGNAVGQQYDPLDDDWAQSARKWGCIPSGLIAFVTGATPGGATGIPVLAHYVRINLTFKMGPGGAPCVQPSPFPREHWDSLLDNPLAIEQYTSSEAAERIAEFGRINGSPDLLILVGHSMGGYTVAKIANEGRLKRTADLLIIIDGYPRGFEIKPGAAKRAINFFTDRGPGDVHGTLVKGAENIYLGAGYRCPLKDCSQGAHHTYDHVNIDDCDYVKRRIFELIQGYFPD